MHEEVHELLDRSPRPLPWRDMVSQCDSRSHLGHPCGRLPSGTNHGRMKVLDAWRLDVRKEYEKLKAS